jgi:F-type H+-transporting ATPase subunit gamma
MSQQLRQLKSRIRSVEGTWKVTRAMEMVSMAKFKAIESPLRMARKYFEKVESFFTNVASVETTVHSPFMSSRKGPLGLLIISADTGLCGVYNYQLTRAVEKFIAANPDREIKLYIYGRKGVGHFRKKGMTITHIFPGMHGRLKADFHQSILEKMTTDFLKHSLAEVYVAHTVFVNAMKSKAKVEKLLHIERPQVKDSNFILEFKNDGVLSELIPLFLSSKLRLMMLESLTSEHASRMVAMKASKDNAKELMGDLVLLRNKVRQAVITKEVIEIISSVEALKG